MRKTTVDILVIGGGIIGITTALAAKRRFPGLSIRIIEKEANCGLHASGRNSGVIHAGFYYTADSLKARMTREGNLALHRYCEDRGIAVNKCGKLVVARDNSELHGLAILKARAAANNVPLEEISERQAKEIQPCVKSVERALYSQSTSSVDPTQVMSALIEDCRKQGIVIHTDTAYLSMLHKDIKTSGGEFSAGYVINAAGLYADKIAQDFGLAQSVCMLPFKGVYLKGTNSATPLRTHVYPVPDLRYPFLGVHLTLNSTGQTKIGPTAIPALWREQYGGLRNFHGRELAHILWQQFRFVLSPKSGMLGLAGREIPKYSKSILKKRALKLVERSLIPDKLHWGPAGIRAQLFDKVKKKLVMDFYYEKGPTSIHILNAVSPAFTCAMPFSEHIVDLIDAPASPSRQSGAQRIT